jgi:hypothetical protein
MNCQHYPSNRNAITLNSFCSVSFISWGSVSTRHHWVFFRTISEFRDWLLRTSTANLLSFCPLHSIIDIDTDIYIEGKADGREKQVLSGIESMSYHLYRWVPSLQGNALIVQTFSLILMIVSVSSIFTLLILNRHNLIHSNFRIFKEWNHRFPFLSDQKWIIWLIPVASVQFSFV